MVKAGIERDITTPRMDQLKWMLKTMSSRLGPFAQSFLPSTVVDLRLFGQIYSTVLKTLISLLLKMVLVVPENVCRFGLVQ